MNNKVQALTRKKEVIKRFCLGPAAFDHFLEMSVNLSEFSTWNVNEN
ncbi:hypothetical protein [Neobacillus soli]|nr:hypothetical protein [Neobacillus soli]